MGNAHLRVSGHVAAMSEGEILDRADKVSTLTKSGMTAFGLDRTNAPVNVLVQGGVCWESSRRLYVRSEMKRRSPLRAINALEPMPRKTPDSTWAEIRTAYAAGIALREIARKLGIPAGTVLARAKGEGWTRQVRDAKALVARSGPPAVPVATGGSPNDATSAASVMWSVWRALWSAGCPLSKQWHRVRCLIVSRTSTASTKWPDEPTACTMATRSIEASVNGGAFTTVVAFRSTVAGSGFLALDTNNDGSPPQSRSRKTNRGRSFLPTSR